LAACVLVVAIAAEQMRRRHRAVGRIDRDIVVAVQAEDADFAYAGRGRLSLFMEPPLMKMFPAASRLLTIP
jgi:hypothetical protein